MDRNFQGEYDTRQLIFCPGSGHPTRADYATIAQEPEPWFRQALGC